MRLKGIINKVLPPINPAPEGKKPPKKPVPLADKDLCENCGVRSAWKTLRISLEFKDDESAKKVKELMDSLEEQYKFEVK